MNAYLEDSDEPLDDNEYPSDDDYDFEDEEYGDDEPAYVTCNYCGASVYEELEQCPECGNYVTVSTSPWQDRPMWWIVLGALGLVAMIIALSLL